MQASESCKQLHQILNTCQKKKKFWKYFYIVFHVWIGWFFVVSNFEGPSNSLKLQSETEVGHFKEFCKSEADIEFTWITFLWTHLKHLLELVWGLFLTGGKNTRLRNKLPALDLYSARPSSFKEMQNQLLASWQSFPSWGSDLSGETNAAPSSRDLLHPPRLLKSKS